MGINRMGLLGSILLFTGRNWKYITIYFGEDGAAQVDVFGVAGIYALAMLFFALWKSHANFPGGWNDCWIN